MLLRNFYLKLKRKLFKRLTGINPEDIRKLVYVQKYLDMHERKILSFDEWRKQNENKCDNKCGCK